MYLNLNRQQTLTTAHHMQRTDSREICPPLYREIHVRSCAVVASERETQWRAIDAQMIDRK